MSTRDANEYVLGTDDTELSRLGFQHRIWSEFAHALWERAGFAPGHTVADVGCGPGFATLDLAQIVTERGRVIALDVSERYLAHLRARARALGIANVDVHAADLQELDLPPASIDGAYARWVLCWLPDPERAIAAIARALRPGGAFAVQDYFNYRALTLAPRSPAFARVIEAVIASFAASRSDSDVVARLPALFEKHGLECREIRPIQRIARPGSLLWQWPSTFFASYVPRLVEGGFLTVEEQRAFERDWAERSRDPNTFFFAPTVFDVIGVKRR